VVGEPTYGHQLVNYAPNPPFSEFGIYSLGTGITAQGSFSVWVNRWPDPTVTNYIWRTAKVTCALINGSSASITGKLTTSGHTEIVVASVVAGSPGSGRVIFASPPANYEVSPGCSVSDASPIPLKGGDIRIF
jgi:hypothetical protein